MKSLSSISLKLNFVLGIKAVCSSLLYNNLFLLSFSLFLLFFNLNKFWIVFIWFIFSFFLILSIKWSSFKGNRIPLVLFPSILFLSFVINLIGFKGRIIPFCNFVFNFLSFVMKQLLLFIVLKLLLFFGNKLLFVLLFFILISFVIKYWFFL